MANDVKTMVNSTIEQDVRSITNAITEGIKDSSNGAQDFESKQAFSKAMTDTLSEAYGVKMTATNMKNRYSGNIAFLVEKIDELEKKDSLSETQKTELNNSMELLAQSKARWGYWYGGIKANYKKESLVKDETLYKAYDKKRENNDGFRKALASYFEKNYGMILKNPTIDYINNTIGRKRAAMTQADKHQTVSFNTTEFFLFLTDTMIEIAIAKKQMNIGVACEVVTTSYNAIDELDNIYAVPKRTPETTIATMKDILDQVAYSTKGLKTKADYIDAWKKALKAGLFVEY